MKKSEIKNPAHYCSLFFCWVFVSFYISTSSFYYGLNIFHYLVFLPVGIYYSHLIISKEKTHWRAAMRALTSLGLLSLSAWVIYLNPSSDSWVFPLPFVLGSCIMGVMQLLLIGMEFFEPAFAS